MHVSIKVIMSGVTGRTGREVARAIEAQPDLELVAAVGRASSGQPLAPLLGGAPDARRVYPTLQAAFSAEPEAEVWVDFTQREATEAMLPEAIRLGLQAVVGTSGLGAAFLSGLEPEIRRFGTAVAVIPNFAMGAVLLERLARQAFAQYGTAEVIELHSAHKRDKPSATALWLSESLGGVPIHSVRLPGLVAHQEVLFGGEGEVFTIRHDVLARSAYGGGVVAAIRAIRGKCGLFRSLEELLRTEADEEAIDS